MVNLERRQKQRACTASGFTFIRPGVFPLPRYRFKATLGSPYPTATGDSSDYSRLQICWFSDEIGLAIDEMVFSVLERSIGTQLLPTMIATMGKSLRSDAF